MAESTTASEPATSSILDPLSLTDLPPELLNVVATFLPRSDLLELRALNNRRLRDGVDNVFVS